MRTCKCGFSGPDSKFVDRIDNGRRSKRNRCIKCELIRNVKRMSTPEARAKNNALKRKLRETNALKIGEYLTTHPCVDCGESDILVLQFDHVRGSKSFMISDSLNSHRWDSILIEIAKCDVRCANCHIRKTTLERDYIPHRLKALNFKPLPRSS